MPDFTARRTMMVDTQVRPSDVTKFPIIDAMLSIPREEFVPAALREAAYMGENLDLGDGRVLLEPRTLAKMLDALDVSNDELVLDVGAAMGYSSAVIAKMAEAVVAVEEDEALYGEAQEALTTAGVDNVILHHGPLVEGAAQHGPYDVIVIEGAAQKVPEAIMDQLKDGGRIACLFQEGALGELRIGLKQAGKVSWRMSFNAGAAVLPGFETEKAFEF
ncbi:MAG: protein-L-isoaspartate O-methyltransferase, partial [Roseobacter sp.]